MPHTHTNVGNRVNTNVGMFHDTFVGMATFGDRVKHERELRGWSFQELADRVTKAVRENCPRVTIEKIEARSANISKWSRGIALALEVDHDWLLTGKGQKKILPSIDRRLKALKPDISELLHEQFEALIDNAIAKSERRQ